MGGPKVWPNGKRWEKTSKWPNNSPTGLITLLWTVNACRVATAWNLDVIGGICWRRGFPLSQRSFLLEMVKGLDVCKPILETRPNLTCVVSTLGRKSEHLIRHGVKCMFSYFSTCTFTSPSSSTFTP